MKAVFFNQFGGSNVLEIGTLETPTSLGPLDVRIRVSHTSVNPVDWKIREGFLQGMLPHQFPIIPGWDVAGTIDALGTQVQNFQLGDEVYAYARKEVVQFGTYAEYIVLPESFVALKPRTLPLQSSASIPLTALTAWQALHEIVKVQKGDTLLVTAGAGGVGSFAIQFAKVLGATVIATGSIENAAYMKALGADYVIDYRNESTSTVILNLFPDGIQGVFDAVGGETLTESYKVLARGGRLVSIVDTPNNEQLTAAGAHGAFHFVYPSGEQLKAIKNHIDEGHVKVPAITVGSLKEAAHYQDLNAQRHTRGKVVLTMDL